MRVVSFAIVALWSSTACADLFDIKISLEDQDLVPGEPIVAKISVKQKIGQNIGFGFSYRSVACKVLDEEGKVTTEHQDTWHVESSLLYEYIFFSECPGEEITDEMPLTYWFSSMLPPGNYVAVFSFEWIQYYRGAYGKRHHESERYSPPKTVQVPFTVRPPDTKALRTSFDELLQRIEQPAPEGKAEGAYKRPAIDAIVYSRHPVALDYQIALLRRYWRKDSPLWNTGYVDDERARPNDIMTAYTIDIGRYFISTQSAEVAKAVVALASETQHDEDSFFHREPRYLNWIIYSLWDSQKQDVVAATREYVSEHPRQRPPGVGEFLDYMLH